MAIVAARLWPGRDALVLNVSAGGVLIESASRLLPGVIVHLHLHTRDGAVAMRGLVLRSCVLRLGSSALSYSSAIAFDRMLTCEAEMRIDYPLAISQE